jgi:hypothetical protein
MRKARVGWLALLATAWIVLSAASSWAQEADSLPTATAADLRVEWVDGDDSAASSKPDSVQLDARKIAAAPVIGKSGQTVRLRYRIRNTGGMDAFAVLVRVQTGLGRNGPPVRLQPGPKAGSALERDLDLALAVGMAEVCVEASLQTLRADDPSDPYQDNNRACRQIRLKTIGKGNAS